MKRLLSFSSLFPNAVEPQKGIFVAERLRHLLATGQVNASVVAPVPWFPLSASWAGKYGRFARVPREAEFESSTVQYPRYPVVPKIGMTIAPFLMANATRNVVRAALRRGVDVIDAHYFYPDGVAAYRLARELKIPVVITARGSDINLVAGFAGPRRQIIEAAKGCDAVVCVSQKLKQALIELGVGSAQITVIRNGVDLSRFQRCADRLGKSAPDDCTATVLIVGNLVEEKGHVLAFEVIRQLSAVRLVVAGDGPLRKRLHTLAATLGIKHRVRFLGAVEQAALPRWYSMADCLLVTSSREGLPNVILESLACGTPVVSCDVGGVTEVLTVPAAGVLVRGRQPEQLAAAVRSLIEDRPESESVRTHARSFNWNETSRQLLELFDKVVDRAAK